MAFVFASTTPLGIVIGLAVQTTYDAQSPMALAIAGIFDSISSGEPHPPHAMCCQPYFGMLVGLHTLQCCLQALLPKKKKFQPRSILPARIP